MTVSYLRLFSGMSYFFRKTYCVKKGRAKRQHCYSQGAHGEPILLHLVQKL